MSPFKAIPDELPILAVVRWSRASRLRLREVSGRFLRLAEAVSRCSPRLLPLRGPPSSPLAGFRGTGRPKRSGNRVLGDDLPNASDTVKDN